MTIDSKLSERKVMIPEPDQLGTRSLIKEERISKSELRRNICITWIIILTLMFMAFTPSLLGKSAKDAFIALMYPLAMTVAVVMICVSLFRLFAAITDFIDEPYSAGRANSLIFLIFNKRAYRQGRYVGIKVSANFDDKLPEEWISKLAEFTARQKCSPTRPLIIRSHLLSVRRWRQQFIEHMQSAGMSCTVQADLPILFPFVLKWLTPAIMSLGGKIPAMNAKEVEIVVTPCADQETSVRYELYKSSVNVSD